MSDAMNVTIPDLLGSDGGKGTGNLHSKWKTPQTILEVGLHDVDDILTRIELWTVRGEEYRKDLKLC
jgi:hypothetical protein